MVDSPLVGDYAVKGGGSASDNDGDSPSPFILRVLRAFAVNLLGSRNVPASLEYILPRRREGREEDAGVYPHPKAPHVYAGL